ncbi:adenosine receptor A1-like [Liolophura sinensis]|uniref:adenosine receptor A1-like n=1 Tax=Liolophura sinensis TaxID=3198878 RepID=UPI003159491A
MNSTSGYEEATPRHFLWSPIEITRFVLLISAGCTIVLFNTLIIILIAKYRKLRTWTNCLLLSMAVADLLVGVLSIPTHLIADVSLLGKHIMWCIVLNIPTVIIPTASIMSLIAASVERLLAIASPLRYPLWISRRRILITVIFIWVYSVTLGLLPVFGWNNIEERRKTNHPLRDCNFAAVMSGHYTGLFIAGNIFPGMVFLLCLNIKLFIIVKSQRSKAPSIGNISRSGSVAGLNDGRQAPHVPQTPVQRSRRVVFILLVICHVTILCYIPVCVAFVVDYQWFTVTTITEWRAPYILYAIGTFLGAINSLVNPVILGFANREIRKHLKLMCRLNLTKSDSSNSMSLIMCSANRQLS